MSEIYGNIQYCVTAAGEKISLPGLKREFLNVSVGVGINFKFSSKSTTRKRC
jgi:hypothetical protein